MKKIKEINNYNDLLTSIDIPHLSDLGLTVEELSFTLKFNWSKCY